jgi:hypothetical protein
MIERYMGMERCTSVSQVVRYLTENYTDGEGVPMPRHVALSIVETGADQIRKGMEIFGSNVEYLGDEALKDVPGWTWIPEPDAGDDGDDFWEA